MAPGARLRLLRTPLTIGFIALLSFTIIRILLIDREPTFSMDAQATEAIYEGTADSAAHNNVSGGPEGRKYRVVPGIFMQEDPATDAATFDYVSTLYTWANE
jgi:hypothetical protein